jgi:hypothetical protein
MPFLNFFPSINNKFIVIAGRDYNFSIPRMDLTPMVQVRGIIRVEGVHAGMFVDLHILTTVFAGERMAVTRMAFLRATLSKT